MENVKWKEYVCSRKVGERGKREESENLLGKDAESLWREVSKVLRHILSIFHFPIAIPSITILIDKKTECNTKRSDTPQM